ncbi:MAG: undecaprenyl-diphosphate phosphatase [Chitinophagaceae bacterium]
MNFFEAILIAIVEGLTEFIPVSSTAHMIFTSTALGIQEDEYVKMFQVSIQFGAILAVVVLYWEKFFNFQNIRFYLKLALAVMPALVLGYLFNEKIETLLESPLPIAIVLVLGGIVLLFVDRMFKDPEVTSEKQLSIPKAMVIGFWQCLAMMPGVSRSAASIIGGMQQKLSRKLAAEFSFFLAVPTMLAVTVYSIFLKEWGTGPVKHKGYEMIVENKQNLYAFIGGNVAAFFVAIIAIKFFINFLTRYGFRIWGIYRIIAGLILLVLMLTGAIG